MPLPARIKSLRPVLATELVAGRPALRGPGREKGFPASLYRAALSIP